MNATARVYRMYICVAVAALLMGAAASKTYETFLSTPRETAWFEVAFLPEAAIIAFEAAVGGWLLARVYPRLCWLAAGVAFVGMAVLNVVYLATGKSSCGCFGVIDVPPGVSLLCDPLALSLLWTIVQRPIVGSALVCTNPVGGVGAIWTTSEGARIRSSAMAVRSSSPDSVWCHTSPRYPERSSIAWEGSL